MSFVGLLIIAFVVWLVAQWRARTPSHADRASMGALDAWAVDELVALVESVAPGAPAALRATFGGCALEPTIVSWARTHALRASLRFTRRRGGAEVVLCSSFDRGERAARRTMAWDDLPSSVRGRLLGGERALVQPWRAPWVHQDVP